MLAAALLTQLCSATTGFLLLNNCVKVCRLSDRHGGLVMIDFKGAQFPKSVILLAVFFYLRYPVSYRDLQEILTERSITVHHATLNR